MTRRRRSPPRLLQPYELEAAIMLAIHNRLSGSVNAAAIYAKGRRAAHQARMAVQAIRLRNARDALAWCEALCAPAAYSEVAVSRLEDAGRDVDAADVRADFSDPMLLTFEKSWLKLIASGVLSPDEREEMVGRHQAIGARYGNT